MANTAKPDSKRQIAFQALDTMAGVPRAEAIQVLVDRLGVSKVYATTLFQTHRQDRSKNTEGNGFVTIFKVRDTRSNQAVAPFMSKMVRNNPDDDEARDPETAIIQYITDSKRKIKLAEKLS